MSNKTTASVSFIMAMQWDYVPARKRKAYSRNPYSISMNDRLNMEEALNLLMNVDGLKAGEKPLWKPYQAVCSTSREIKHPWAISGQQKEPLYNEYLYFNHNNRQIIYNQDEIEDNKPFDVAKARAYAKMVQKKQRNVVVLERNLPSNGKDAPYYYLMRSVTKRNGKDKTLLDKWEYIVYRLPINSIELRIYDVGIMLLSIRCNHEKNAAASQYCKMSGSFETDQQKYILNKKSKQEYTLNKKCKQECTLNKKCRSDFEELFNGKDFNTDIDEDDLSWILDCGRRLFCPRNLVNDKDFPNELPLYSQITLGANNDSIVLCDYIPDESGSTPKSIPAEGFPWMEELLSPHCASAKSSQSGNASRNKACLILDCFNDDRMYLHGTVVSDLLAQNISDAYVHRSNPSDKQKSSLMKWHAIAFADNNWNSCNCPDYEMVCKLAEGYTYPRWSGYQTLYALNYHNMIQLLGKDSANEYLYLTTNMDWIYYQLFLIGILQRCCLQRFYREASGIPLTRKGNKAVLRTALKDRYIIFLNRIWGNEVTEQEQGREMFDMLQKSMMLEKDVSFLDQALEELNEQERKSLETSINKILIPFSIIGGLATISSLVPFHESIIEKILVKISTLTDTLSSILYWVCFALCGLIAFLTLFYSAKVVLELLKRPLTRLSKKR